MSFLKINSERKRKWAIIAFATIFPIVFTAIFSSLPNAIAKHLIETLGLHPIISYYCLIFFLPVISFWWLPIKNRLLLIPIIGVYLFCMGYFIFFETLIVACTVDSSGCE